MMNTEPPVKPENVSKKPEADQSKTGSPSEAESQLLREQLIEMAKQVEGLKTKLGKQKYTESEETSEEKSLDTLSIEEAQSMLMENPVEFVSMIMEEQGKKHLGDLKEQAELEGALRQFKRAHPEASQFQSFIMEEVAELIKNDPDGVIDPWGELLEKGLQVFEEKFRETIKNNPELLKSKTDEAKGKESITKTAFVEGAVSRKPSEEATQFSREQIGKMSLKEFLKNEDLINEALQNGRIR